MSIELNEDSYPTIDIFFRDVEIFKDTPVIQTLESLSNAVADIIGNFIEFVSSRSD